MLALVSEATRWRRDIGRMVDVLLWCLTVVAALLAAVAHFTGAPPVLRFFGTLAAITLASAVLGRALDQLGGRMRPAAIGTFQAVVGNLPELIICIFALRAGLITVVQAALIGSVLNLLLLGNGLAYLTGGLRNGTMTIDGRHAKVTRVMLVLLMATLITPAIAVNLGTPAAQHTNAVSYVVAIALLVVFVVALPFRLGKNADAPPPVHNGAGEAKVGTWPLPRVLLVVGAAGLLIAFEADWLMDALLPATEAMNLNAAFVGLFLVATVGNLSQLVPAVQLSLRGDADTATAITMEGALQVALMLAPVLTLIAPLLGAGEFTLIFPPLQIVAVIVAALLVVFVTIDGTVNHLEGLALVALYTVLGSLFWWG
ncbi:sodium:proton exchanger [Micromonospora zingiberis]|uniref:Sodium:proton exchanger n=1 Tax=Micromonospora zingiberis TaxID=2053011 RepID=A0A4R0GIV9_9ACTN|nr:sodium:proton exchanger [Micromonospora zingiberis]TCB95281.1 sodium:proton exchanger [Micromonospora zingiberis]